MPYYPDRHHRRSVRIPGYDYSTTGAYFITICVEGRRCLLGEVAGDTMKPNDAGLMIQCGWAELAHRFPAATPGEFVVMPNHIHGILYLGTHPTVGAALRGICSN
jgi:REP element-mobilizing transposase RayT